MPDNTARPPEGDDAPPRRARIDVNYLPDPKIKQQHRYVKLAQLQSKLLQERLGEALRIGQDLKAARQAHQNALAAQPPTEPAVIQALESSIQALESAIQPAFAQAHEEAHRLLSLMAHAGGWVTRGEDRGLRRGDVALAMGAMRSGIALEQLKKIAAEMQDPDKSLILGQIADAEQVQMQRQTLEGARQEVVSALRVVRGRASTRNQAAVMETLMELPKHIRALGEAHLNLTQREYQINPPDLSLVLAVGAKYAETSLAEVKAIFAQANPHAAADWADHLDQAIAYERENRKFVQDSYNVAMKNHRSEYRDDNKIRKRQMPRTGEVLKHKWGKRLRFGLVSAIALTVRDNIRERRLGRPLTVHDRREPFERLVTREGPQPEARRQPNTVTDEDFEIFAPPAMDPDVADAIAGVDSGPNPEANPNSEPEPRPTVRPFLVEDYLPPATRKEQRTYRAMALAHFEEMGETGNAAQWKNLLALLARTGGWMERDGKTVQRPADRALALGAMHANISLYELERLASKLPASDEQSAREKEFILENIAAAQEVFPNQYQRLQYTGLAQKAFQAAKANPGRGTTGLPDGHIAHLPALYMEIGQRLTNDYNNYYRDNPPSDGTMMAIGAAWCGHDLQEARTCFEKWCPDQTGRWEALFNEAIAYAQENPDDLQAHIARLTAAEAGETKELRRFATRAQVASVLSWLQQAGRNRWQRLREGGRALLRRNARDAGEEITAEGDATVREPSQIRRRSTHLSLREQMAANRARLREDAQRARRPRNVEERLKRSPYERYERA